MEPVEIDGLADQGVEAGFLRAATILGAVVTGHGDQHQIPQIGIEAAGPREPTAVQTAMQRQVAQHHVHRRAPCFFQSGEAVMGDANAKPFQLQ